MANDTFALSLQGGAPSEADFEAIQDVFMESARGRWFLVEYARRNRHADTAILLAALTRIETMLHARQHDQPAQNAVEANPAAIKPDGRSESKSVPVEHVLVEAAAQLRAALEPVQDLAWSLRERGDARCELLDIRAKEIAQSCDLFETLQKELNAPPPEPKTAETLEAFFDLPARTSEQQAAPGDPARPTFRITPVMPDRRTAPADDVQANEPPEPSDASLDAILFDESDEESPMPDLRAQTERIVQPEPLRAIAPAPEKPGENAPADDTARMSPSERLKNIFNELHQARWGSQTDKEAAFVRAEEPVVDRVGASEETEERGEPAILAAENLFGEAFSFALPSAEENEQPSPTEPAEEPWPRVSSLSGAPGKPEGPSNPETPREKPVTPVAPTASRPAQNDPLAAIVGLSDEEKIALFS